MLLEILYVIYIYNNIHNHIYIDAYMERERESERIREITPVRQLDG